MGTWGVNLYQDDTALDVKEEYKYKLHMGKTNKEATEEIIEENQDLIEDIEEQSLFWFALADTQWNLGRLEEYVKNEALKYIELGTDLERWKDDTKLYEKRRKVLEKLREKLLAPQPEEKKMSKYRIYKCEWKIGDVFAYKLKSEYAKQNKLENRYLIMQKVDETAWYPAHIIPMVRIKITNDGTIPKTEDEINKLEYIQTDLGKAANHNKNLVRPSKYSNERQRIYIGIYEKSPEQYIKENLKVKLTGKKIIKSIIPNKMQRILKKMRGMVK